VSSPAPPGDIRSHETFVDWEDLSGLDRIRAVYQVGPNVIVVETSAGREVRVTAMFDYRTGKYVTEFERRAKISSGGHQLSVWAHTQAYPRIVADELVGCLEEAILLVDQTPVY
jgi:hypothetical protein